MHKLNQKGFSAFEIILLILVIALTGFAGYTVYEKNKPDPVSQVTIPVKDKNDATTPETSDTYKTPQGYVTYENKELGFKFDYPSQYGQDFIKDPVYSQAYNDISIITTTSKTEVSAGIAKELRIWTHQSASSSIGTRKYGPKVQLRDGKWIVTETNDADVSENKIGSEYRDFEGNAVRAKDNNGLLVYLFKGGDEGIVVDNLVFVTNSKVHQIELRFDTGTYGEQTTANDQKPYDTMLMNIKNSIFELK